MRYPVRNGLALPITEVGYEEVPFQKRRTNQHHLYFEKGWYQDKRYRQVFRGLLPHVVTMGVEQHDLLHLTFSAPVMPRDSLMIGVIDEYLSMNGVIDVVRERCTHETYQLMPSEWQGIRAQYKGR